MEDHNDCSAEIQQSLAHTSYEFTDFRPGTTYKIELRAENAVGLSNPAQIKVKTAVGKQDEYFSYTYSTSGVKSYFTGNVVLVAVSLSALFLR